MDRVENSFLELKIVKPWLWLLRYIDDKFFIWTGAEDKLEGFLSSLNSSIIISYLSFFNFLFFDYLPIFRM